MTESVARSAVRVVRLHNLYTTVDPEKEKPLRAAFRRELRILVRRAIKLYAYLVLYMKKPGQDARFQEENKDVFPGGNRS